MKKLIGAALAVAVLVAAFVAYRAGMFGGEAPSAGTPAEAGGRARPGSGTAGISGGNVGAAGGAVTTATSVPGETPDARGAVAAGGTGPATGTAGAISGTTATGVDIATLARDGNIALLDFGAHIESVSDEHNRHRFGASYLLADDPNLYWCVHAKDSPKDVVLSFFAHQPVLIQSVVILPGHKGDDKDAWLKDVEIWTSTESPSSGFAKVASATMRQELVEQTIPIEPAEARYVKLRVVSNYGSSLTLYSNQGYKGTVDLTLAPTPADPGLQFHFEPASVPLEEISATTPTVTAAASASPQPHVLTVKGINASGKTETLCLQLTERTTGGIQVLSDLRRDRKPTKNLEIILDSSGSMKAALGKKTRWRTALDVLEQVLQKLPDDFNVGLRIYGHRESSLSPKTCTDSELVVPIGKLHRGRLLSAARGVQPRGETPLVYSVLQTPEDLKAVGGGAVILITDGEESCKGDVKAAAQAVRQSGLDVTVNIVGFTLTGKQTQAQLTTLAEGTGGHYYVAQSGEALARALLIAAVEKFPYVIYDAAGKAVAKGEAGGAPEELPAGEYRVAITSGDQTLTEAVTVATGGDVRLRVQLKGDKFVVQR